MNNPALLSGWIRRFLLEHLVGERNLAYNTQQSYRDTLRLLIPFISETMGKKINCLEVEDLTAERVCNFLCQLEKNRNIRICTRNQRLAAIHSLAQFIGIRSPEYILWSGTIKAIPFKKVSKPLVTYLDKIEMEAILATPDVNTPLGHRDYTLLLFLYNTGTRADEAAKLLIGDLNIGATPERDSSFVIIRGKGNKLRQCPLWVKTVHEINRLIKGCDKTNHVFLNRLGQPITRHGIHAMVKRYAYKATKMVPSIGPKKVSPHTIRHTTAMHLLKAGVDINTIRAWLGHASLNTTNIYAEADIEMKEKALKACEIKEGSENKHPWREDRDLMAFLRSI